MKNNKGFSLVELIIVIAIMAILVGVMAPQLIRYIEKTNVSADTQLCDSVHTAVLTGLMDPAALTSAAGVPNLTSAKELSTIASSTNYPEFYNSVIKTLGWGDLGSANYKAKLKSEAKKASALIMVQTYGAGGNACATWITCSDKSGDKVTTYAPASLTASDIDKVIFVD